MNLPLPFSFISTLSPSLVLLLWIRLCLLFNVHLIFSLCFSQDHEQRAQKQYLGHITIFGLVKIILDFQLQKTKWYGEDFFYSKWSLVLAKLNTSYNHSCVCASNDCSQISSMGPSQRKKLTPQLLLKIPCSDGLGIEF